VNASRRAGREVEAGRCIDESEQGDPRLPETRRAYSAVLDLHGGLAVGWDRSPRTHFPVNTAPLQVANCEVVVSGVSLNEPVRAIA
jgi:hypothetical protein